VIIGGGFSGAAAAFHLLRDAPAGLDVILVEPSGQLGRGLAYFNLQRQPLPERAGGDEPIAILYAERFTKPTP